jgi:hypothetical protein
MDIPSIIDHNYYIVRGTRSNRTWICEAKRFDDKNKKLYYYYGTYELGSEEHKNNDYLSDSYYNILPKENDEIRLATMEEIDILMDILEKNGVVITLQEAKDKAKAPDLKGEDYSNKRFGYKIPDGYEFDKVDNNQIILKPIKPKYPKTYKECQTILDNYSTGKVSGYKAMLLSTLGKIIVCRDAYWKITGEQMGLGKSWEPDWKNLKQKKYCIYCSEDDIQKGFWWQNNSILAFPTEEIRDAFYENFKELIEECKELL